MRLIISGTDFTKFVTQSGYKRTRNDIDGVNAGRTLDGKMHRDRVTIKLKLEIQMNRMTADEYRQLLLALEPQTIFVQFDDPLRGAITLEMYSNNVTATCVMVDTDGTEQWDNISFPLIEV